MAHEDNYILFNSYDIKDKPHNTYISSYEKHFDSIAYFIEIYTINFGYQYIWCSFNAYTNIKEHLIFPSPYILYVSLNDVYLKTNILNSISGNLKNCRLECNYNKTTIVQNNNNIFDISCVKENVFLGNNLYNDKAYKYVKFHIYIKPTFASFIDESKKYNLQYSIDIPLYKKQLQYTYNSVDLNIPCNPFTSIAYMLYLQGHNNTIEYIWINMDTFSNDINEISIPKVTSLQCNLKNIHIISNKLGNKYFNTGYIEYSPYVYKHNEYGFKRSLNGEGKYGCFQIYGNNELLIAYNNHTNIPDIGIGYCNNGFHDWTFMQNALNYKIKKLEIYTKDCIACTYTDAVRNMKLLYYYSITEKSRDLIHQFYNNQFNKVGIFMKTQSNWIYVSFDIHEILPCTSFMISNDTNVQIIVYNVFVETQGQKFYYKEAYFESTQHDYDINFKFFFNNLYTYGNYGTYKMFTQDTVLFSYSNHNGIPDVGIGNCAYGIVDWTFTGNSSNQVIFEIFTNKATLYPTVIFLVTGQSNSQGWGGIYEEYNIQDQVDYRILGWNTESNIWSIFNLNNTVGTKPKNMQCFAFHFAKCFLADHPNEIVGIIIHSLGGQCIEKWIYDGEMYNECVCVTKKCLGVSNLRHIHGILWHQGEADYMNTHEYYEHSLNTVINQFRNEYFFNEYIPFIAGELLNNNTYDKQNRVLEKLNFNGDKYIRCAYTRYLQCNVNDNLHFSTMSHRLMGQLYYDQYKIIFS